MGTYVIHGGTPLRGEVWASGSKNASLLLMCASLLADGPVELLGVPDIRDVDVMVEILRELGVSIDRFGRDMTLRVVDDSACSPPGELVRKLRASVCILGPMLARRGCVSTGLPGGCCLGERPIGLHMRGLQALGASIELNSGTLSCDVRGGLQGAPVHLMGTHGSTVTGTANVVMAAALANGTTTIEGAAMEPEVVSLCRMLVDMGAHIEGIGGPFLVIRGKERLHGCRFQVPVDRIESGTLLLTGLASRGDVSVPNAPRWQLEALRWALESVGTPLEDLLGPEGLSARYNRRPDSWVITCLPYPGFPTDLQPIMSVLLCMASGASTVQDRVYPERFLYLNELRKMGARINNFGDVATISGVSVLTGADVAAVDLRGAAALVVAGLSASGTTRVSGSEHLDRGYENIVGKLRGIGAQIEKEA